MFIEGLWWLRGMILTLSKREIIRSPREGDREIMEKRRGKIKVLRKEREN